MRGARVFGRIQSARGTMTTAVTGADGDAIVELPTPDPAFHWTAETWGYALRCGPLGDTAQHAFTTKQLQLQAAEWQRATAAVGVTPDNLLRVRQVHGRTVRIVRKGRVSKDDVSAKPDGDAIVSDASGFVLAVQVADCVPILMVDRRSCTAAAVHAGWRGTSAAVTRAAIEAMVHEFGTLPEHIVAAIGPSIGPCCYVVGPDVLAAFHSAGFSNDDVNRWFVRSDATSLRLDLWSANRDQLIAAGVRADHVFLSGLCTRTHPELLASYRADGADAGRMAALIAVP
jgi:hypothetical protein